MTGLTGRIDMDLACADKRRHGGHMTVGAIGNRHRGVRVHFDQAAMILGMTVKVGAMTDLTVGTGSLAGGTAT